MGVFSVIEEVPGRFPVVVSQHLHRADAVRTAERVAWKLRVLDRVMDGRVSVQAPDSADQLQVDRRGRALRDQPALAAVGEDVTVYVPTAKVGASHG